MPVFISYHRPDQRQAEEIQERLSHRHHIKVYLDVLDSSITPQNVTEVILRQLSACTHLLALLSSTTINSWWVPFEIGAATKEQARIASYLTSNIVVPQYLTMWPRLMNLNHLDLFAIRYNQDRKPLEKSLRVTEAYSARIQSDTEFHRPSSQTWVNKHVMATTSATHESVA